MEKNQITALHSGFESVVQKENNIEFWFARDLQKLLGYEKWENFSQVIDKAKMACIGSNQNVSDHFPDVRKMINLGKGAQREIDDIKLTRYACYLIAQNGDSRKIQKAKDFANEITAFNTQRDNLRGENTITNEHVKNNINVRGLLKKENIIPENLPPAEDIKKLNRKLKSENKKLVE